MKTFTEANDEIDELLIREGLITRKEADKRNLYGDIFVFGVMTIVILLVVLTVLWGIRQ